MIRLSRGSTGEVLNPDSTVQRVTPNKKGNRPTATIAWLPTVNNGMVHLRFGQNVRETSAALYDIVCTDDSGDDDEGAS